MSTVTLRGVKGAPLTNTELDDNFSNINSDKMEKSSNLSDVQSVSTARTNLDVPSTTDLSDVEVLALAGL
jgi:hypothetical protein